jgi:hypothetical protein
MPRVCHTFIQGASQNRQDIKKFLLAQISCRTGLAPTSLFAGLVEILKN